MSLEIGAVPYEFRRGKAGVRLKRAYSRKICVAMRVRLFSQEPYCNFAYSALACFRMGMSGSASFQIAKKDLQGVTNVGLAQRNDELPNLENTLSTHTLG